MPYYTIPGLPESRVWKPAPPEAGPNALHASLRECLEWSARASVQAAAELQELADNPQPPDQPPEALSNALTALDEALGLLFRQWQENKRAPIAFYSMPDEAETLNHATLDAAMHEAVLLWPDFDYPETMTIGRYRRRELDPPHFVKPLQDLIDALDEEYAGEGPEGGLDRPPPSLQAAENRLLRQTMLEYRNHWHEQADAVQVNTWSWISRHRPDLMRRRSLTKAVCHHCRRLAGAQSMRSCPRCRRRGCARCWLNIEPRTPDWRLCEQKLQARSRPSA